MKAAYKQAIFLTMAVSVITAIIMVEWNSASIPARVMPIVWLAEGMLLMFAASCLKTVVALGRGSGESILHGLLYDKEREL